LRRVDLSRRGETGGCGGCENRWEDRLRPIEGQGSGVQQRGITLSFFVAIIFLPALLRVIVDKWDEDKKEL
jgi:hypothetical protein